MREASGQTLIEIIHGSVRPWQTFRRARDWMSKMQSSYERYGAVVRTFGWSGIPPLAYRQGLAAKFLQHLIQDIEDVWQEGGTHPLIAIHAKSLGTHIAEEALRLAQQSEASFECDVLLRIAGPHVFAPVPAGRVVSVYTNEDRLALGGTLMARAFGKREHLQSGDTHLNSRVIELQGFSHSDLNRNLYVKTGEFAGVKLHDLYYSLITKPPCEEQSM